MSKRSSTEWIDLLGRPSTWSAWGLVVATVVATIVFTFGNLLLVMSAPLETLAANTLLTVAIVAILGALARLLSDRLSPPRAGITVSVALLALSAARGYGLQWVINVVGFEDDMTAGFRAVVSVSVFAPGLVLSVLIVELVRQWRKNQSEIEALREQREKTLETTRSAVDAYLSDLSEGVRREIEPTLRSIPSLGSAQARQALKDIINSIVRPLSTALHNPRGDLVEVPPARSVRVAVQKFINLALQGAPLAPGLTGLIFGLTLLPRNLASGSVWEGLGATLALGVIIGAGTAGINAISRRLLRRLPAWAHLGLLGVILSILGSLVALLSQLLTGSSLGFDNVFLVGATATVTLSVLLGGVVNATRYVAQQRLERKHLEADIEREIAAARRLQWQRHRSLGNMLHGPLQAALNSGTIRLSRATTSEEIRDVSDWLTDEVSSLLDLGTSPENSLSDVRVAIERITDTWEGICAIAWTVDDSLLDSMVAQPVSGAIADVVVEAVFNAIKHQSPDRVDVEIAEEKPDRIRLTVSHPGSLLATSRPGLGTQTFASLTSSFKWQEHAGRVVFDAVFYR